MKLYLDSIQVINELPILCIIILHYICDCIGRSLDRAAHWVGEAACILRASGFIDWVRGFFSRLIMFHGYARCAASVLIRTPLTSLSHIVWVVAAGRRARPWNVQH